MSLAETSEAEEEGIESNAGKEEVAEGDKMHPFFSTYVSAVNLNLNWKNMSQTACFVYFERAYL